MGQLGMSFAENRACPSVLGLSVRIMSKGSFPVDPGQGPHLCFMTSRLRPQLTPSVGPPPPGARAHTKGAQHCWAWRPWTKPELSAWLLAK